MLMPGHKCLLYVISSFAIYSVNMNLYIYYVMTFLIMQKGHHGENENNSAVRLYRQALAGFLTIYIHRISPDTRTC